jgi:hypothetical protein
MPVVVLIEPATTLKLDRVTVLGPAITNVLKSIRSWQMSVLHLQTVTPHWPAPGEVEDWKKVVFSAVVLPHPKVNVQQTPKLFAQDPDEVPPLLAHSEAV